MPFYMFAFRDPKEILAEADLKHDAEVGERGGKYNRRDERCGKVSVIKEPYREVASQSVLHSCFQAMRPQSLRCFRARKEHVGSVVLAKIGPREFFGAAVREMER